eukprot:m51a1_g12215 hypothetical protein (331) ;mRNA; r:18385-19649
MADAVREPVTTSLFDEARVVVLSSLETDALARCSLREPSLAGKGLKDVLEDKRLRARFARFLQAELSGENLKFLTRATTFSRMSPTTSPHELKFEALKIWRRFMDTDAEEQINLPSSITLDIRARLFGPEGPPHNTKHEKRSHRLCRSRKSESSVVVRSPDVGSPLLSPATKSVSCTDNCSPRSRRSLTKTLRASLVRAVRKSETSVELAGAAEAERKRREEDQRSSGVSFGRSVSEVLPGSTQCFLSPVQKKLEAGQLPPPFEVDCSSASSLGVEQTIVEEQEPATGSVEAATTWAGLLKSIGKTLDEVDALSESSESESDPPDDSSDE